MEVEVKFPENLDIRNSLDTIYCLTNEQMQELNVNLKESTNFLVQLFYKTGRKYSCSRTKIGKMLTILAFRYARKGEILFAESIYKYDDCGTAINELKVIVDRDVYVRSRYEDKEQQIDIPMNVNQFYIPNKHLNVETLSLGVQKEIEKVFCYFGAYSARKLGQDLNAIITKGQITKTNGEIDLSQIHILSKEFFFSYEDTNLNNSIIRYLFN